MIVALSLVEIDMLFSFSSETEGRWGARAGGGAEMKMMSHLHSAVDMKKLWLSVDR